MIPLNVIVFCYSYKKNQIVGGREKDDETLSDLNQLKQENSKTRLTEEQTKKASKALILQKIKTVKAKKIASEDVFPKIEIIGSPPSIASVDSNADGIYASQRLKNPPAGMLGKAFRCVPVTILLLWFVCSIWLLSGHEILLFSLC